MKKLELNQMEILNGGAPQKLKNADDTAGNPIDCGIGLAGLALTVIGAAAVVTTGGAAIFAASFILGSIGTARSC